MARWVAERGFNPESGAREIRHVIQREVEPRLAAHCVARYQDHPDGPGARELYGLYEPTGPRAWEKIRKEHEKLVAENERAVKEEEVYRWKEKLKSYVIAPIDKHTGECCVI